MRGRLAALGAAVLLAAGACRSAAPPPEPAVPPGAESSWGVGALWNALSAAVEDGDQALAEALVERLRPWAREAAERARLAAFERVLRARALAGQVELRLVSEPTDRPGEYRLVLLVRSRAPEPVVLRLPPARLTRAVAVFGRGGDGTRELRTTHTDALEELELRPGRSVRRVLARSRLEPGSALAVRERWSLATLAGEWETPAERLPASRLAVEPCERVRLGERVPPVPASVEELAGAVHAGALAPEELFVLGLRVPSSERRRALRELAPLVDSLAADEPERVLALAPLLRWLCGGAPGGLAPREWAALVAAAGGAPERPRLELGTARRGG